MCVGQTSYQCLIFYITPHIKQLRQKQSMLILTGLIFQQCPKTFNFLCICPSYFRILIMKTPFDRRGFRWECELVPQCCLCSPNVWLVFSPEQNVMMFSIFWHLILGTICTPFPRNRWKMRTNYQRSGTLIHKRIITPPPLERGNRVLCKLVCTLATLATLTKTVQNNQTFLMLCHDAFYHVDWLLSPFDPNIGAAY